MHVGCSGWAYDAWRGRLYPEGLPQRRWLARYAEVFDTVEVNNTFYRLASPRGRRGWVEQTPEDFVFTVKVSRYITHIKRLSELGRGVKRFYEPLEPLVEAGKLGPVLWQLPANFQRDDERLAARSSSFPRAGTASSSATRAGSTPPSTTLRAHEVALVIGDDPERPFQTHERTAEWTFIRFHRGSRGRNGNYSDAEIDTWAAGSRSGAAT